MLRVRSLVHSEVVHNDDDDDDDDDDDGEQWPWQARNDDHVPTEAPCTTPPDHRITLHDAVAGPLPLLCATCHMRANGSEQLSYIARPAWAS